ncbi:signal recognition particle, SRP9/SRP14 subunit [Hypoxylon fragiforme]|uniref:signal recognition particle, SRP9/SRP14 subunit n=1 Tax=Hypoxylon fragiforme TaxID=63214 RepID=UPI0020C6D403|nr:signal recognition particle, SRP9/SRP14 subunit [Hypoxylon fragiforme]KAI2602981.1 signal recognition particle, SRP9/SRP14 subunit [Hypoxylon fragiforme]
MMKTFIPQFFVKLTELFDQRKGKDRGSITLVQKRLSYDQPLSEPTSDTTFPDLNPPRPMPVLIRATNSKGKKRREDKIKLSTVVEPESLSVFFEKYAEVCKSGMTSLKPRDRSKRKGKAKKKKGTATASGP